MNRAIFTSRRPAAKATAYLAAVGAVGALTMAVAHTGAGVPLVERLGPAAPVPPAAVGFFVGAALYAGLAVLAWRQASAAWPFGFAVNFVALVSATVPYRGAVSAVAAAVSVAAVIVLLSPSGREAFGRK
ncbi:MAG TPA: hypothetical protein VM307_06060 [Egibacteraceae bacterium]|nr:hypothetical protein [Egibacteraceae bacterium]